MWESLKKINPMTLAKYRSPRTKASNRRKNEAPRGINNHTFTLIVTQVTLSLFNSCLCCSWVICFKIRVFRFHSFLKLSIHHLNITCNQSKHAMRYVLVSSVLIKLHIPMFFWVLHNYFADRNHCARLSLYTYDKNERKPIPVYELGQGVPNDAAISSKITAKRRQKPF